MDENVITRTVRALFLELSITRGPHGHTWSLTAFGFTLLAFSHHETEMLNESE